MSWLLRVLLGFVLGPVWGLLRRAATWFLKRPEALVILVLALVLAFEYTQARFWQAQTAAKDHALQQERARSRQLGSALKQQNAAVDQLAAKAKAQAALVGQAQRSAAAIQQRYQRLLHAPPAAIGPTCADAVNWLKRESGALAQGWNR